MMKKSFVRGGLVSALLLSVSLVAGCGQGGGQAEATKEQPPVAEKPKHEGWWCVEHGIPEEECSMCLPARTVKAEFKDKGDWCDDHNRAKSQCFICDPSLKEKFAAKYRAKFGTEPPPITEE
jgi:hypothetical protein